MQSRLPGEALGSLCSDKMTATSTASHTPSHLILRAGRCYWPHFTDEETEAQTEAVTCPVELSPHGHSTESLSGEGSPALGLIFPQL